MAAAPAPEFDTADAVLAFARGRRSDADAAEADLLKAAVQWAAMHSVDSIHDAACFGDAPVPVAGPGAPLVAEFSISEFSAALRLPTEHGKAYVGEAIELRYRLPEHWRRVLKGDLQAWRARRIARATMCLSPEAAAYVDRCIARFAHKIRPSAIDRAIQAAIARYMPDEAAARAEAAADGRRFDIDTRPLDMNGTAEVYGVLDLADALDLDAAVTQTAATLKDLGSDAALDVRRSMAVGEIARNQLALDLTDSNDGSVVEEVAQRPSRNHHPAGREVVLFVHLSEAALRGADPVGHLDNVNTPVLTRQIQTWCGTAANVTVKPVIDLNKCEPVDSALIPDRHHEQTKLRDRHCVFPWCTRKATACDDDHVSPHSRGGPTCPCNLAPLCRRHHRLKTHGHWTYTVINPGTYLWTSPHGYHYLRDPEGTQDVSRDRPRPTPPDE